MPPSCRVDSDDGRISNASAPPRPGAGRHSDRGGAPVNIERIYRTTVAADELAQVPCRYRPRGYEPQSGSIGTKME